MWIHSYINVGGSVLTTNEFVLRTRKSWRQDIHSHCTDKLECVFNSCLTEFGGDRARKKSQLFIRKSLPHPNFLQKRMQSASLCIDYFSISTSTKLINILFFQTRISTTFTSDIESTDETFRKLHLLSHAFILMFKKSTTWQSSWKNLRTPLIISNSFS